MAYAVYTPGNLTIAIQQISAFLETEMGWTATYSNGVADVTIPGKPALFSISRSQLDYYGQHDGGFSFEVLHINVSNVPTPWESITNWLSPLNRLWVFAGSAPEPWCLLVFETAPGIFFHTYFGYVEKLGTYDGGAIADGTIYPAPRTTTNQEWNEYGMHLLFNGNYSYSHVRSETGPRDSGAIEIQHADAPFSAYYFAMNTSSGRENAFASGGWGDAYNTMLAWNDATLIDGSTTLHPLILFAMLQGGYGTWNTPVACVPGIRAINMDLFEEGQIITVGNEDWQVFPLLTRRVGYEENFDPADAPGSIQPDQNGVYDYRFSGATERLGLAVRREA